MKKTIITYLIFIFIGFMIGKILFSRTSFINISKAKNRYYFIQEGEYVNNNLFDSVSNLREKILEYKNDKIYVYLAITKDLEVAERLVDIYKERNMTVTIKEKYIENDALRLSLEQFDFLVKKSKTKEEILKIEEVVIANYKEITK